jgi:hypothetical protein
MRKVLPILLLVLLPTVVLAQGTLRVTSTLGPVEWRSVSSSSFVPLSAAMPAVQLGDQVRTGPGGTLILEVPDGSYMVISENTTLTIEDSWSGNFKNLVNVMMGKVRFYIQRLGGRPNPYRVMTPTALIAVRGTTFEVTIDDAQTAEIRCLEGRVAVESVGLSDREVILETGRKTLVRPGEYPVTPVGNDEALARNRVIHLVKKSVPDANPNAAPSAEIFARDNDRRNRASDPLQSPGSRTSGSAERAKPTLSFPQ